MRNPPEEPQAYVFDDIRLDLRLLVVTRAGQPVPLEPKAFEVLRHLVEHRDRLVTKEELLDTVWKDVFVTPNVLTRSIAQVRKALGDEAHGSRYIQTVAKRGYRFIGPARPAPVAPQETLPPAELPAEPLPEPRPGSLSATGPSRRRVPAWTLAVAMAIACAAVLWIGWRAFSPEPPPALPSVQRITASGDVIDAVISRDGTYVAYVRSAGGQQSLWLRQTSGASALQLLPPAPVGYWGIAFAPDSASIYYTVKGPPPDQDPAGTLYTIPVLPGPPPRRITSGIDSAVTFSPDGTRIAFFRLEREPAGVSSLVIANGDGSDERVLASQQAPRLFVPAFFVAPSWSPDGSRISAAIQDDESYGSTLVTIGVDDGKQTRLQAEAISAGFTTWMPDGSGILFVGQMRLSWAASPQIWLQPADGGPARRITADTIEYRNVSVTADGRAIVSVGTEHVASLWSVDAASGGEPMRIPSMRGDGLGGMSVSGDRLIFNGEEGGDLQLWSMKRDGSERRQITNGGWNAWPAVSADGGTIYYVSYRPPTAGIWRADADGRNPRQLAEVAAPTLLRLSPDGRWLYFTSQSVGEDSTWRVPADGGVPEFVVRGLGWATLSPDGRLLAGIWRPDRHSVHEMAVFPADGGTPLYRFPGNYAAGGGERVHWTDDGTALLYTTVERANVWRRPLEGGEPERLTSFGDGSIFGFTPAPDGATLLLSRGPSIRDAFLIRRSR